MEINRSVFAQIIFFLLFFLEVILEIRANPPVDSANASDNAGSRDKLIVDFVSCQLRQLQKVRTAKKQKTNVVLTIISLRFDWIFPKTCLEIGEGRGDSAEMVWYLLLVNEVFNALTSKQFVSWFVQLHRLLRPSCTMRVSSIVLPYKQENGGKEVVLLDTTAFGHKPL
jgi:hypothetical protein